MNKINFQIKLEHGHNFVEDCDGQAIICTKCNIIAHKKDDKSIIYDPSLYCNKTFYSWFCQDIQNKKHGVRK